MRISKTFKQIRKPGNTYDYLPQLTGEITCALNNQYGMDSVYKYGGSNSVSFTANIFLTQNDVYLIKKHTGKQLPEGSFATVRICMFGKDGDHLARQPLCKHGQKIAFYADDWQISSYYTAKGDLRYKFDAVCNYYRFIDDSEVEEQPEPQPEPQPQPKVDPKKIPNKYGVTQEEIDAVLRKAEEALSDDLPF